MASSDERYNVVLVSCADVPEGRNGALRAMVKGFKLDSAFAEQLLDSLPALVRRDASKEEAMRQAGALRALGFDTAVVAGGSAPEEEDDPNAGPLRMTGVSDRFEFPEGAVSSGAFGALESQRGAPGTDTGDSGGVHLARLALRQTRAGKKVLASERVLQDEIDNVARELRGGLDEPVSGDVDAALAYLEKSAPGVGDSAGFEAAFSAFELPAGVSGEFDQADEEPDAERPVRDTQSELDAIDDAPEPGDFEDPDELFGPPGWGSRRDSELSGPMSAVVDKVKASLGDGGVEEQRPAIDPPPDEGGTSTTEPPKSPSEPAEPDDDFARLLTSSGGHPIVEGADESSPQTGGTLLMSPASISASSGGNRFLEFGEEGGEDSDPEAAESFFAGVFEAGDGSEDDVMLPGTDPDSDETPLDDVATEQMTCPACGKEQPASETCAHCGVVVAKYGARESQPSVIEASASPADVPSMSNARSGMSIPWVPILTIVVLAGGGVAAWFWNDARTSTPAYKFANAGRFVEIEHRPIDGPSHILGCAAVGERRLLCEAKPSLVVALLNPENADEMELSEAGCLLRIETTPGVQRRVLQGCRVTGTVGGAAVDSEFSYHAVRRCERGLGELAEGDTVICSSEIDEGATIVPEFAEARLPSETREIFEYEETTSIETAGGTREVMEFVITFADGRQERGYYDPSLGIFVRRQRASREPHIDLVFVQSGAERVGTPHWERAGP